LADEGEKIQTIFNYLRIRKRRAATLPWLSPEEAWLLPALDCKAFSVLMLELLKQLGIKAELWIGLSGREGEGHAWLEVGINGEKRVLDRNCRRTVPAREYRRIHPYTLITRVA
jgi:transglutaminase-like putative cysteine protease